MDIQDTLINEFITNIKSNTITKERYQLLVNYLIDNTILGYNDKSKLRVSDDYKILDLVKLFETEKYNNRLKELNNELNNEEF